MLIPIASRNYPDKPAIYYEELAIYAVIAVAINVIHDDGAVVLFLAGDIGRVTSVDFSWYLDVYHGAAYFRRWHRLRSAGGSLWVH